MNRIFLFLILAILLIAGMWVSSGNMTPYSAVLENPNFTDCRGNLLDSTQLASKIANNQKAYMANYDHLLYKANYHMLNGDPKEEWIFNIVQRRILYYVIAFPFMKWLGFSMGGLLTTVLLTLAAILYAWNFIRKKYGHKSALFFMLIMSTYPGIMYWCGTSFAQVLVTPLCLLFFIKMLVYEENSSTKNAFYLSFVFGIGFLGYDLAAYFLPAAFLLFCYKKQWKHLPFVLLMLLPSMLLNLFYSKVVGFDLMNDNTSIYKNILFSYQNMTWETLLLKAKTVPFVLYRNYVDSQFLYLAVLGFVLLFICLAFKRKKISASAVLLLGSMLFIFLFSNMAPSYEGSWHIEGTWIARIYQPAFVVIVFAMVSLIRDLETFSIIQRVVMLASFLIFVLNTLVVFGPISGYFGTVSVYEQFYHSSPHGTMEYNIRKYGAKPLGL